MKLAIFTAVATLTLPFGAMSTNAVPAQSQSRAATIDSTSSFDFVSRINGESYEVTVYVPEGKAPPAGYPTLYLLDGEKVFGTFVNAVSNEGFMNETEPAVVVGISGGPGEQSAKRSFDFTPVDLTDDEKSSWWILGEVLEPGDMKTSCESFRRRSNLASRVWRLWIGTATSFSAGRLEDSLSSIPY